MNIYFNWGPNWCIFLFLNIYLRLCGSTSARSPWSTLMGSLIPPEILQIFITT